MSCNVSKDVIDSVIDNVIEDVNCNVIRLLNEQIALEFSSAYLYLGCAAKLEGMMLPGAAGYYKVQANEEVSHGMRIFNYLVRIGARPELLPIRTPEHIPDTFTAIANSVLAHEEYISKSIYDIYKCALVDNDYKTQVFLHWFIDEQMEEEQNAREIIDDIKRFKECKAGLIMLDKKMGGRKS